MGGQERRQGVIGLMVDGVGRAAGAIRRLGRLMPFVRRGWREGRAPPCSCNDAAVERVQHALARLALFPREVWLLAARDGLGDAEIASRLGIGQDEVRRYLGQALAELADLLEHKGGGA